MEAVKRNSDEMPTRWRDTPRLSPAEEISDAPLKEEYNALPYRGGGKLTTNNGG